MKLLIRTCLMIGLVFAALYSDASAQQWSPEQKDVWSGVEKYWEVSSQGDAQAFMSYFDDSYMGWNFRSRVPMNKSNVSKWIKEEMKNTSTILYSITPLTIWVNGNFAYVHYTYSQLLKNNETGKKIPSSGVWTDILMKKNGKWMLIGDHGGQTSNNKNSESE